MPDPRSPNNIARHAKTQDSGYAHPSAAYMNADSFRPGSYVAARENYAKRRRVCLTLGRGPIPGMACLLVLTTTWIAEACGVCENQGSLIYRLLDPPCVQEQSSPWVARQATEDLSATIPCCFDCGGSCWLCGIEFKEARAVALLPYS